MVAERTRLLAAEAVRLRGEGRTAREIAAALGISRSYATSLYADPDRTQERARKDSYSLPCPDCGEPMTGSDGPGKSPERCWRCAPQRTWTREAMVEAFQEFAEAMGRSPSTTDTQIFNPSVASRMSPERVTESVRARDLGLRLPHPALVKGEFGGWPEAMLAAGLEPPGLGGEPSHRNRRPLSERSRAVLFALGEHGAKTRVQIQELCGHLVSKDTMLSLLARGFVERDHDPAHRSRFVYRLAEAGLKEAQMPDNAWVVFEPVSEKGDTITLKLLGRCSAPTRAMAVERLGGKPGLFHCVRARDWEDPLPLGLVEKLAVIREG